MYASPEFLSLGESLRGLLNTLTAEHSTSQKERIKNYFLQSSRYEYLFWEMAYTQEEWKI